MKKYSLIFLVLLGACGGSHYDAAENAAIVNDNGNGGVKGPNDVFATQVANVTAASEDSDTIDVDTVSVTTPDTTEPVAL